MEENQLSIFDIIAADKLAGEVNKLVQRGIIDARSGAADALLNYASSRFGDQNPIGYLEEKIKTYK